MDRNCIERVRNFSSPPVLVGQVMEMVMTLIGKRLPSQRIQEVKDYPQGKDEMSSRMSSSSSGTKVIKKCKISPYGLFFKFLNMLNICNSL